MTTVAIIKAPEANQVMQMFLNHGFTCFLALDPKDLKLHTTDLVCFVGGADVTPALYGEENTNSFNDVLRDERETTIYQCLSREMPKVGICRGGQFLNVMSGGKMIQHIEGHQNCTHTIFWWDNEKEGYLKVKGDHHQAMKPNYNGHTMAWNMDDDVPEVVWYPNTNSLCFQPHPEWGHKPTENYFFELLNRYFNL